MNFTNGTDGLTEWLPELLVGAKNTIFLLLTWISPLNILVCYQTIPVCLSLFNWADNGSLIQHLHRPPPRRFYHNDHSPVSVWSLNIKYAQKHKYSSSIGKSPNMVSFPNVLKWKCWEHLEKVLTFRSNLRLIGNLVLCKMSEICTNFHNQQQSTYTPLHQ